MVKVNIKFAPVEVMGQFYFSKEQIDVANKNRKAYTDGPGFYVNVEGEDAAEEAFDLSNNPSRQDERVKVYGRGRSVSVGDIVEIEDGKAYLCASFGWKELV